MDKRKAQSTREGWPGVGDTWGRERGSSSGFEAQKAKNMLLGFVPSKLITSQTSIFILCMERGEFYSLVHFMDSLYTFCLCLALSPSAVMPLRISFNKSLSSTDCAKRDGRRVE